MLIDLWANTRAASCTECAVIVDLAAYDHHLIDTVMSRAGLQQPHSPREGIAWDLASLCSNLHPSYISGQIRGPASRAFAWSGPQIWREFEIGR